MGISSQSLDRPDNHSSTPLLLADVTVMSDTGNITAAGASQLSQAQLGNQIATRVAVKANDAAKAQGQAVLSLLQGAMEIQQQAIAQARQGKGLDVIA